MNDIELLERSRVYINKMANGINPITDKPVDDSDLINNVRISRCLFFVSDVLKKVIAENGLNRMINDQEQQEYDGKKSKKERFFPDSEKLESFKFFKQPTFISEFVREINKCKLNEKMRNISSGRITKWLVNKGFLYIDTDESGKKVKRLTKEGEEIGIIVEKRIGHRGEYNAVLYSLTAQHFLIDNLEAILSE